MFQLAMEGGSIAEIHVELVWRLMVGRLAGLDGDGTRGATWSLLTPRSAMAFPEAPAAIARARARCREDCRAN